MVMWDWNFSDVSDWQEKSFESSSVHLECSQNSYTWYHTTITVSTWILSNFTIQFQGSMEESFTGGYYNKYWGIAKITLDYGDHATELPSSGTGSTDKWIDDESETDWTLVEYTYLNGSEHPGGIDPTEGAYDGVSKWHGYLSWGPYWLNRTFYIEDNAPDGFKYNYDVTVTFDFVGYCDFDWNDPLILFIDDRYAWEMVYDEIRDGIVWQRANNTWLIDCSQEAEDRAAYLVLNIQSDTIHNVSGDKEFSISFFMQYSLEAADEGGLISNLSVNYEAIELVPCGCTDTPTSIPSPNPTLEPTLIYRPTQVPTIQAPRVEQDAEYDVLNDVITITWDVATDYGEISAIDRILGFDCAESGLFDLDYVGLVGSEATCYWITATRMRIIPSSDNTFSINETQNELLFSPGIIGTSETDSDGNNVKQFNRTYLFLDAIFLKNFQNSDVDARLDGSTTITVCNDVYLYTSDSSGNYGQSFKRYSWNVTYDDPDGDYFNLNDHLMNTLGMGLDESTFSVPAIDLVGAVYETVSDVTTDVEWPIEITISVLITNWLGNSDRDFAVLTIYNNVSLGIIDIIGNQYGREIVHNEPHLLRALASVTICNQTVGFVNSSDSDSASNDSATSVSDIYDYFESQGLIEYHWQMIQDTAELLALSDAIDTRLHPAINISDYEVESNFDIIGYPAIYANYTFESNYTSLFLPAYSLQMFNYYLFELSVTVGNFTNTEYLSAFIMPPEIYQLISPFLIVRADTSIDLGVSVSELFYISNIYSGDNLTISELLTNEDGEYNVYWQCYYQETDVGETVLQLAESIDISSFDKLEWDPCPSSDFNVPNGTLSIPINATSLFEDACYAFQLSINDPYWNQLLQNQYYLCISTPRPTTSPTALPTNMPSVTPSAVPSTTPSTDPTKIPTTQPSAIPTNSPTSDPTNDPTPSPTNNPTSDPTTGPTPSPTPQPTNDPTVAPTADPSISPSSEPTNNPTVSPTDPPTRIPSTEPSNEPSTIPSAVPTYSPTLVTSPPIPIIKIKSPNRRRHHHRGNPHSRRRFSAVILNWNEIKEYYDITSYSQYNIDYEWVAISDNIDIYDSPWITTHGGGCVCDLCFTFAFVFHF